jgi:hypothetical protein
MLVARFEDRHLFSRARQLACRHQARGTALTSRK